MIKRRTWIVNYYTEHSKSNLRSAYLVGIDNGTVTVRNKEEEFKIKEEAVRDIVLKGDEK